MPSEQVQQLPERLAGNVLGANTVADKQWKDAASAAFDVLLVELEHVTNKKFTEYREQLPRQSVWLLDAFKRVGTDDRAALRPPAYRVDDSARVNTLGLACLVSYFNGWLRKRNR